MAAGREIILPVNDYDLDATMSSGQVFAWEQSGNGWAGVLAGHWVHLRSTHGGISAATTEPQADWSWLTRFLQTEVDLSDIIATFPPDDPHLHRAVTACRGLRLLRQDPWECLASFILSSTKQIVQIRQIVRWLSERHGHPVAAPPGPFRPFAFPSPTKVASLPEAELRECKMGFRAKYLRAAAQQVAGGELKLEDLRHRTLAEARSELMRLPGVGEKIADCVLLFAYGFPAAFPIDVWVARTLRRDYLRGRRVRPDQLRRFIQRHFGSNAGYAQQYLFHHARTKSR